MYLKYLYFFKYAYFWKLASYIIFITWTLLIYIFWKLNLVILTTLAFSAELLTDFSYTNFTVSYRYALGRPRVHSNIISEYRGRIRKYGPVTLTFDLWPWKSAGLVRLSKHISVQNFIKISAAVHELSCAERKINSDEKQYSPSLPRGQ